MWLGTSQKRKAKCPGAYEKVLPLLVTMGLKNKSITRHDYNGLSRQHQLLTKIGSNGPSQGADVEIQNSLKPLRKLFGDRKSVV